MLDYICYTLSDSIYNIGILIFGLLIDPFLFFQVISPRAFWLFMMDMFFASYTNDWNVAVSLFLYLYLDVLADGSFQFLIKTKINNIIERI